jgi:hypothetical protein
VANYGKNMVGKAHAYIEVGPLLELDATQKAILAMLDTVAAGLWFAQSGAISRLSMHGQ